MKHDLLEEENRTDRAGAGQKLNPRALLVPVVYHVRLNVVLEEQARLVEAWGEWVHWPVRGLVRVEKKIRIQMKMAQG